MNDCLDVKYSSVAKINCRNSKSRDFVDEVSSRGRSKDYKCSCRNESTQKLNMSHAVFFRICQNDRLA